MLGTVVKMEGDRLRILVKNDAACCGGGSGGCACGGADPVYVDAQRSKNVMAEEGDMVEFQAQDSSWGGIAKVFGLPLGLFFLGWNGLPLVLGRTDQPLQLAAGLGLALTVFVGSLLIPSGKGLPLVTAKVPNHSLKAFSLPQDN